MTAMLEIRLLGAFEVRVDGQPLAPLHSRKEHWLLAMLILRHDRPVERDWLAGTLWPDSPQSQALAYLRRTLAYLRQAFGPQAARLQSPTWQTLRLDLTNANVDLVAFDAAISRGDPSSLEEAVSVYRGPLLEGWTEEWMLPERQQRERCCLNALEILADHAINNSDAGSAVGYLQRLITADPLRESARRSLMQAHAVQGDYAAASQVYRDLRLHLHEELNVEPSAETTALFTRLRQQGRESTQPSAARSAPAPPTTPLPTTPPRHRLPRPLTQLIGREQEIPEIISRLSADCLVTLTGSGGVGKTRLALQVAYELANDHLDGAWFVELAGVHDPALVAQTLYSQLELQDQSNRPLLQSLLDYLHNRQALLVLDNCEHLVSACADLVQAVLQTCPRVRVLATSRQSLGLTGEVVWRVPALEVPDEGRLDWIEKDASSLLEYAGVQLFVERAQQSSPQFQVSGQNAMAVAQVCARLEGVPLAIELAAARVRVISPVEMLAQWERRRDFLVTRKRDADPRHQTLWASIEWSYRLLPADLQRFFVRLSVFRGGWTAQAAEQVCGKDEGTGIPSSFILHPSSFALAPSSLDFLDHLLDASLIQAEQREGVTRFRMLETLWEFGWELLAQDERTATCRRHRDYYLRLAEEAEPGMRTADLPIWLERLDIEQGNFQAALDWCAETSGEGQAGMHLVGALSSYWFCRNEVTEGRRRLHQFRARQDAQEATAGRGRALFGGILMATRQGDTREARSLQAEGAAVWETLGDAAGIARARYYDGFVAVGELDQPLARARSKEYLGWCREHGTELEIFDAAMQTAYYAVNVEEARTLFAESLDIARRAGQTRRLMILLHNWGKTELRDWTNYERAEPLLVESLRLSRDINDKYFIALALKDLGAIVMHRGEGGRARVLLDEAVMMFREVGFRPFTADISTELGHLCLDEGEYAAARQHFEEAAVLYRETGNRTGLGNECMALGHLCLYEGDYASARRHYEEGLALRREIGVLWPVSWSVLEVGLVAVVQSDIPAARSAIVEALQLFEAQEDREAVLACLESFAGLAAAQGESERAARLFGAAEEQRATGGMHGPMFWTHHQQRLLASVETLRTDAFTTAWQEGRAMTLEQAVAYSRDTGG